MLGKATALFYKSRDEWVGRGSVGRPFFCFNPHPRIYVLILEKGVEGERERAREREKH